MKGIANRIKKYMVVILLFVTYIIDVAYMAINGKTLLDSDMASEMVLSDILNKEHSVLGITKSWYYSTEIRVFETQWFYRIGLLLSPNNWHVARTIGMAIALALLAFAVWFLFWALEMENWGRFAAAICLFPSGSWYFWQTIFGGYYLPYIYISLFSLAFVVLATKGPKYHIGYVLGIVFLGIASGLNGVKQLMVFYAPFVLAMFMLVLIAVRNSETEHLRVTELKTFTEFKYLILSLLGTAGALFGYVINTKILAKQFHFAQFDGTEISGRSIWELFRYYIWSFGYADGMALMSLRGIAAMLGVVIGLATVLSGLRLLCRISELDIYERFLTSVSFITVAFSIFIYSYVNGNIQYFQPIVPFGLFLIILELKTERYVLESSKEVATGLFALFLIISSLGTMRNEFSEPFHPYNAKQDMVHMVEFLEYNGYSTGIARFWNSNIITELSDGRIDMWTVVNYESDDMYEWLQKSEHIGNFPNVDSKYFLISDAGENVDEFLKRHPQLELVYGDDRYYVYGN